MQRHFIMILTTFLKANAVYHNDVKPLSRLEKENKYSSKLLPTGDLPKPRNSDNFPPLPDFSLPNSEIG